MIAIRQLYETLLDTYGPQHWWPADDAFEVIVGAVLVQRTAWRNAELALGNLSARGLIVPERLGAVPLSELGSLIRSAGFWSMKAQRLARIAHAVVDAGGMEELACRDTGTLRKLLLALNGVGEETADTILLYAFDRPVVVIDAYFRRVAERLAGDERNRRAGTVDDVLRAHTLSALTAVSDLNEFHALLVEHGKRFCRSSPDCARCCLRQSCAIGRRDEQGSEGQALKGASM